VSKSLKKKKTYYNSFGATTGECTSVLALGRSSYSTIGDDLYYQNHYIQNDYQIKLENGIIPVERGWTLDKDTILRRDIIKNIRTYFSIDKNEISDKYQINFDKYFSKEINKLKSFFDDELLFIENDKIYLTEIGKHFANLIGSNFDIFIDSKRFNDRIEYNSSLKI
jgi:oxygen-independent coproporphyrinogen-3 oxidase